ncbi:MAG: YdiU family protein [Rhodoferax sp.]|nr:YdiU family protein [Rhodoferax sp.]
MPLQTLGLKVNRDNSAMHRLPPTVQPEPSVLPWDNRFQQLGTHFYTPTLPQPLPAPYWVGRSPQTAALLGLDAIWLGSDKLLQAVSGNLPLHGTEPLASVYSGHQFGQWAGQLGDGRALLLGELNGLEVQLKGSGLTPYSRRGDGRAVLRSSIREFLCSEAMHALGIPTTRALCVTGSDLPVRRESMETAAVVTRVAPSFIRFGHFEHFSARGQIPALRTLADYVIDRYYPACKTPAQFNGNTYAALLQAVTERTAQMVAHWQAVGFCHGVMNTDNMSILGLTLDYGPFAFLDAYHPGHICNHSDHAGRYAFDAQPDIAHWNLYALAQALLPLIESQHLAVQALDTFKPLCDQHYQRLMCAKLGLPAKGPTDPTVLIDDLLALLARDRVDYTIFWRSLSHGRVQNQYEAVRDRFIDRLAWDTWLLRYQELIALDGQALETNLMLKTNPKFVLRNYLCEEAIEAAQQQDFSAVQRLLNVMTHPFDEQPDAQAMAGYPPDWASRIEISCSS